MAGRMGEAAMLGAVPQEELLIHGNQNKKKLKGTEGVQGTGGQVNKRSPWANSSK